MSKPQPKPPLPLTTTALTNPSSSAAGAGAGGPGGPPAAEAKARGANRSTKVAHKLKVLPEQPDPLSQSRIGSGPEDEGDADEEEEEEEEDAAAEEQDEDDEVEVYKQVAQIPPGTARKDALRLTKKMAKRLPRVTAYCTATSYHMGDLMKFFNARRESYKTNPRQFDEVIYTPYRYPDTTPSRQTAAVVAAPPPSVDLLGIPELVEGGLAESGTEETLNGKVVKKKKRSKFEADPDGGAEIFLFEYGTVVIWGMTEAQEKRFLSSLKRFEVEKLASEDVEMEDLNYYYANYSRIYNDVITLRRGSSYMTKLSLSHALAQSAKISLFEELISSTIEQTKDIPEIISQTGKIGMPHTEIMQQIGQLFLLRTNLNLVASVLDSPEIFWTFPDLQPLYDAARSYLEIPQRINLLNARVEVLQDMLKLLKESVSSRHAERLEQIVIVLIGIEILLGVITILVDLFSV